MSKSTIAAVLVTAVVVAVPLAWGTLLAAVEQQIVRRAQPVAEQWAADEGWLVTELSYRPGGPPDAQLEPRDLRP